MRMLTSSCARLVAGSDLKEACSLDPKSKEIREAYASIKTAQATCVPPRVVTPRPRLPPSHLAAVAPPCTSRAAEVLLVAHAWSSAKEADKGLFAKMVKGAGGVKKKPPAGVPADAVDLCDDGGLCKRILVEGDAAEGTPFDGAEVQVHYVGTLLSDGSKFDSSRDRPGNFSFKIGQGAVIKGWDKGVATMHKGEKAELFCRADYAYGESGSPPKIPGGATLKFEVELLSWGPAAPSDHSGTDEGAPMGDSMIVAWHAVPQVCWVWRVSWWRAFGA